MRNFSDTIQRKDLKKKEKRDSTIREDRNLLRLKKYHNYISKMGLLSIAPL